MSTKKEMILAYLERDSITQKAARLAMHSAEVAFKVAAEEYNQATIGIEEHLLDLSEIMGLDENYNNPFDGYNQVES